MAFASSLCVVEGSIDAGPFFDASGQQGGYVAKPGRVYDEIGSGDESLVSVTGLELLPYEDEERAAPCVGREVVHSLVESLSLFENGSRSGGHHQIVVALLEEPDFFLPRGQRFHRVALLAQ